jgi:dTDP-4-dehydrorhamnose 3,5-epimerase
MDIEISRLRDAFLIKPRIFNDKRGYFLEAYNEERFMEYSGLKINFIQDNESGSKKGSLRGLHFQKPPFAQSKLVRVIKGKVQDIIVDIRYGSPTFGQWESYILSEENKHQLFIPKGFAHAFLTLSDTAIFSYKVDNKYNPASDAGIIWNDPELAIDWQLETNSLMLSEKDASLQSFNEYRKKPDFQ